MNKEERTLIGHSTEPDPDGEKHEWLQYKYKDYIFNKEWYMDMEGKYVMGLTLFKKSDKKAMTPFVKYENENYYEVFHSGHSNDLDDDDAIKLIETLMEKYDER